MAVGELARVRVMSDEELLVGLAGLLGTGRRLMANIIAHLGEVEERRLDLRSGYSSMFAYCTLRLRMSEDEACRRIDVARLARRFPLLFESIASGCLSLSVAALLKPCLTEENLERLVGAVSNKTVQQAREVLATWFPKPDVEAAIRKLPERRAGRGGAHVRRDTGRDASNDMAHGLAHDSAHDTDREEAAANRSEAPPAHDIGTQSGSLASVTPTVVPQSSTPSSAMVSPSCGEVDATILKGSATLAPGFRPGGASRSIEPLSPGRYKLQLTASVALKEKLELARDLLRHTVPSGDLAEILERALDKLIDETMKRRFAARPKFGFGAPRDRCARGHRAAGAWPAGAWPAGAGAFSESAARSAA